MGLTPHQYILSQRVHKAKELILSGEKLSHIPFSVGFSDQSHFIRTLEKYMAILLKNYKKKAILFYTNNFYSFILSINNKTKEL